MVIDISIDRSGRILLDNYCFKVTTSGEPV